MAKKKAQCSVSTRFPVGQLGGCEAMLYEFRQRASASVVEAPDRQLSDPEKYTRRITATKFEESFAYLQLIVPDFLIDSAICLGLIRMVLWIEPTWAVRQCQSFTAAYGPQRGLWIWIPVP